MVGLAVVAKHVEVPVEPDVQRGLLYLILADRVDEEPSRRQRFGYRSIAKYHRSAFGVGETTREPPLIRCRETSIRTSCPESPEWRAGLSYPMFRIFFKLRSSRGGSRWLPRIVYDTSPTYTSPRESTAMPCGAMKRPGSSPSSGSP